MYSGRRSEGCGTCVVDAAKLFSLLLASGNGAYCTILNICHEKNVSEHYSCSLVVEVEEYRHNL